jgi:hypothetical protein
VSRQKINMRDGTLLVIGYDPPFKTWFAMHHDTGDDRDAPRVAIGYGPAEQALLRAERPDAVIGPYPVETAKELLTELIPELMGLEGAEDQPMCVYCGSPPWDPSPACIDHPMERLMR